VDLYVNMIKVDMNFAPTLPLTRTRLKRLPEGWDEYENMITFDMNFAPTLPDDQFGLILNNFEISHIMSPCVAGFLSL
jgi:hypothetical protein